MPSFDKRGGLMSYGDKAFLFFMATVLSLVALLMFVIIPFAASRARDSDAWEAKCHSQAGHVTWTGKDGPHLCIGKDGRIISTR